MLISKQYNLLLFPFLKQQYQQSSIMMLPNRTRTIIPPTTPPIIAPVLSGPLVGVPVVIAMHSTLYTYVHL